MLHYIELHQYQIILTLHTLTKLMNMYRYTVTGALIFSVCISSWTISTGTAQLSKDKICQILQEGIWHIRMKCTACQETYSLFVVFLKFVTYKHKSYWINFIFVILIQKRKKYLVHLSLYILHYCVLLIGENNHFG